MLNLVIRKETARLWKVNTKRPPCNRSMNAVRRSNGHYLMYGTVWCMKLNLHDKDTVRTSKRTDCASIKTTSRLMQFRWIIAVYYRTHMELIIIPGVPKKCIHILHYYLSKLNWITVAICSRKFAQKMAFMRQAGQSKKTAEARLSFEERKTITILIVFSFLKMCTFGTLWASKIHGFES
jgi:hypothetical protein